MKKITLIVLGAILTLGAFNSCEKDDKNPLLGTWEYSKTLSHVESNVDSLSAQMMELMDEGLKGEGGYGTMEFKEDGKCVIDGDDYNYKHEGTTLTISYGDYPETFSVLVADKNLVMSQDFTADFDVTEFESYLDADLTDFKVRKVLLNTHYKKK